MTSRSHETIRVGLRRIIRDQNVPVKARLDAIKLLMRVEGLMAETRQSTSAKDKPRIRPTSEANAKRIRELIAAEQEKKTG
jgi:flagellar biosynthesis component FlhA